MKKNTIKKNFIYFIILTNGALTHCSGDKSLCVITSLQSNSLPHAIGQTQGLKNKVDSKTNASAEAIAEAGLPLQASFLRFYLIYQLNSSNMLYTTNPILISYVRSQDSSNVLKQDASLQGAIQESPHKNDQLPYKNLEKSTNTMPQTHSMLDHLKKEIYAILGHLRNTILLEVRGIKTGAKITDKILQDHTSSINKLEEVQKKLTLKVEELEKHYVQKIDQLLKSNTKLVNDMIQLQSQIDRILRALNEPLSGVR